jgi:hypothetical protein
VVTRSNRATTVAALGCLPFTKCKHRSRGTLVALRRGSGLEASDFAEDYYLSARPQVPGPQVARREVDGFKTVCSLKRGGGRDEEARRVLAMKDWTELGLRGLPSLSARAATFPPSSGPCSTPRPQPSPGPSSASPRTATCARACSRCARRAWPPLRSSAPHRVSLQRSIRHSGRKSCSIPRRTSAGCGSTSTPTSTGTG